MPRFVTLLVTLLLVTTASIAAAQPSLAEPPAKPARKSKATAVGLTVGGIAAGAALFAAAAATDDKSLAGGLAITGVGVSIVGPSLGHLYAGEWGRGTVTALARAAGGYMFVAGFAGMVSSDHPPAVAEPMFYAGAALVVAATLYDLIDSPGAVERHNRRVSITPAAMSTSSGGTAWGVGLGGSF